MIVVYRTVQIYVTSGDEVTLCVRLIEQLDVLASKIQLAQAHQQTLAVLANQRPVGGPH